jgi:hypothetical protein
MILFARLVLAGVMLAVVITIDADAGASGSDCTPEGSAAATLLAGLAADALGGVSLLAGSRA